MKYVYLSAFLFLTASCAALAEEKIATGGPRCEEHTHDIPVATVAASASFYANFFNRAGSISFESNEIFEKAKDQTPTLKAPENLCPHYCFLPESAVFVFRSTPQLFLSDSEDSAHCERLFRATSRKPLRYMKSVASIDELNEWIGDLSRGNGDEGEDLYEKCDASCSPRYEYAIATKRGIAGYEVRAAVVCGPARDRENNLYNLEAFFRWSCDGR